MPNLKILSQFKQQCLKSDFIFFFFRMNLNMFNIVQIKVALHGLADRGICVLEIPLHRLPLFVHCGPGSRICCFDTAGYAAPGGG